MKKTPMRSVRRILSVVIAMYMTVFFSYGMIRYPDAPIHQCAERGFCGKQGQPHTEKEYRQFSTWQSTLSWSWPLGIIALMLLNRDRIHWRGSSTDK
jgi:hypothetical protein